MLKKKLISSASEDFENFQVIGMSQLPTFKGKCNKNFSWVREQEREGGGEVSKAKNLWWEGGKNESFFRIT